MNTFKTFKTAADFRKNLEGSLRDRAIRTGESIQRLRRKVAFDRLLARIFTREPCLFFLKGGYAMELRIAQARATKDMDLTCLKRGENSKEPISDLILQELQTLARVNLNDYFVFQISQPRNDIENAPYGGSQHTVTVVIDSRPFVEFNLDVGGDFLIGHVEKVHGTNWLEFCDIEAPMIFMISVEQQFAEKLHSYTFPRERVNTRAKDLIDLILLLNLKKGTIETFKHNIQRVFRARNTHPLPVVLPEPPIIWQKPFETMAAECGIMHSLMDGFNLVSNFYHEL